MDELGSYGKEMYNEEKKTRLLLSVPNYFKAINMVWKVTQISLNDFVDVINAEVGR